MNAASSAPDEGLTTDQIAAIGTGPLPDLPRPQAQPQHGAQPAQPVQRPAGDARAAGEELADEDNGFDGGQEGNRFDGGAADSRDENEPGPADAAVANASDGSGLAADRESRARLLEGDELQRTVIRWKEIQAQFVDEPRTAVEQADALVTGLMQQLAAMFARERAELEQRWAGGNEVSTEELRQSLRRYRSFFERLLAA
jgi:hypothetical protein